MKIEKRLTAKKCVPCIAVLKDSTIVDFIVRRTDGYSVHPDTNTLTITDVPHLSDLFEFDEKPFIDFYISFKEKQKADFEEAIKSKKEAEEKRLHELTERIKDCQSPVELAEEFGLRLVETANHWSELHSGNSRYAVLISDRREFEIMEIADSVHGIEGTYGEARNRSGEHHHSFNSLWGGLDEYQDNISKNFGDKYFYKSKESEEEYYLERIQESESMEDVKSLIKEWEEIESGFYDCNGTLIISEDDLGSQDFTGYREDVYSYSFAYCFFDNYSFSSNEEEEE